MLNQQEDLEKKHAEMMNQEAVERIKKQQEADLVEAIFFEDDSEIRLRDGKTYRIPPVTLKDARILMKKLGTVHIDAIILNFLPYENKEEDLFDILLLGFRNYPTVTREYLDEHCDLETAKKLINILIGLNGLKKVESGEGDSSAIRDTESGEPLDWGDLFFHLHKDCGLKKWDIWEYTLPQVAELMKRVNKYIQFEVETRMGFPFLRRKGTNSAASSPHASSSQDYQEISEDDIAVLGKVLGGL